MTKQIGEIMIDRSCVIITTSKTNQSEVIDKLISLGGRKSTNPFDAENSFERGHKIIFIYGYSDVKNTEGFSFCITQSIARNQVPCGELLEKDIERYFNVKSFTGRNKLLSTKNAEVYTQHYK